MIIRNETTEAGIRLLLLEGSLDSSTIDSAQAQLLPLVEHGAGHVVIDCERLDYISSAGLKLMVTIAGRLKQAGLKLALCAMRPHIHDVFRISGLFTRMTIVGTRREAEAVVLG